MEHFERFFLPRFPFTVLRFRHWREARDALEAEQIDRVRPGFGPAPFRPCARRTVAFRRRNLEKPLARPGWAGPEVEAQARAVELRFVPWFGGVPRGALAARIL